MEVRVCQACHQIRPGVTLCPGCSGPLTLADETLFIGEAFGKYRIESVLGAGGMGVVYRAIHASLNRAAAVKIVLPQLADEMFGKRFLREAQVLAELKHPNIVEVYDFDLSDWGMPYYVMECLEGAPLRALLKTGAGVAPELLGPILEGAGAGLSFAHRKGVVHRDLKPDNIFIAVYDGKAVAKLLDFGIAKLLSSNEAAGNLTTAGTVMGTPNYLAPEQLLGREIGPHTDQYALALTVVELLAGKAVRAGKTFGEIIGSAIQRPLSVKELPEHLPAPLRAALERATQPDPAARFAEIGEFIAALQLPVPEDGARQLAGRILPLMKQAGSAGTGRAATPAQFTPTQGLSRVDRNAQRTPTVGLSATGRGGATGAAPYAAQVPPTGGLPAYQDLVRPRRSGVKTSLMLAPLLALAAAAVWLSRGHRAGGPSLNLPGEITGTLTPRKTLLLPPDVTSVLGKGKEDGTLILRGGGAVYLLPPDGAQTATRIPLGADEEILGPLYDGLLWKRTGAKLVITDPVKHEDAPWADKLPALTPLPDVDFSASARMQLSPEGSAMAVIQPGKIEIYLIKEQVARLHFSIPWSGMRAPALALGEKTLVAYTGKELAAYHLETGQRFWSAPYGERVYTLALLEGKNWLAVGGWFDRVDLFELAKNDPPLAVPRPGETHSLVWLPDHPTLLIGGSKGLAYFRRELLVGSVWIDEKGKTSDLKILPVDQILEKSANLKPVIVGEGDPVMEIRYTGGLLATLDSSHHLSLRDYRSLAEPRRTSLAKVPIWSLAADGKNLFAGDSDGVLHGGPVGEKPEAFTLHGAGITDLLLRGDTLASTSDDKTIAVWQLPKMNVVWRSKAHDFLVNQLFLQGEPPALWSVSSDGTLKRWDWPQLEEKESLDTRKLLGKKTSLQSLWVSPQGDLALAGSWQHGLVRLEKSGGSWRGELLPVEAQGLYRCAGLEKFDAVLFTGLSPYGAWLYDLRGRKLHRLPSFGLTLYSVAALPGRDAATVAGEGALVRYEFARDGAGAITVRVFVKLHTGLGTLISLATVGDRLAAGSESGELLMLDEKFDGPAVAEETFGK